VTGPIVGVDLGATNVRAAIVDEEGRAGEVAKRRIPRDASPTEVARLVGDLCREAAKWAAPAAVGVGLAGWLDEASGFVHNGPNLGWRDVPFGDLLRDALGGPLVVLTNDLRAIAWGEYLVGAGRRADLLAVVFLGSGIGSSVILGGHILRGASGIACEIGHTRVVPAGGRACGCGQLGCLEAYVGGHNIERRVRSDLETGVTTALVEYAESGADAVTCGVVDRAAQGGDAYARALWDEVSGYLGQALGSLITYLNPDRLILGGGVWSGASLLRSLSGQALARSTSPAALARCRICDPALGERAGLIGAAAMARDALPR
jgi:glucokinase